VTEPANEAALRTVRVEAPGGAYPVHVGRGLLADADRLLGALPGAAAAGVVFPAAVSHVAETVASALSRRGLTVHRFQVPDGEAAKRLEVVAALYDHFAAVPLHRPDPLIAVGGGATTDAVGFAAATWLRGVPLVNVPTTVLAMVDAALGGKTGVDLPAGKNLVGAFHQPRAVLADLDTLSSLPAAERRSGLSEVIKSGLVGDPGLVDAVAAHAQAGRLADPDALAPLIEAAVNVKARVVGADERDTGRRLILNYGHTLGHALERLTNYEGLRHGEAVSLGMVFAARVAELTGLAAPGLADGHRKVLAAAGLPVGGLQVDPDEALAAMATDKKHQDGLRLVLLRAPGQPEVRAAPGRDVLVEALRSLRPAARRPTPRRPAARPTAAG
jgi:3-dehydroquinate synthase